MVPCKAATPADTASSPFRRDQAEQIAPLLKALADPESGCVCRCPWLPSHAVTVRACVCTTLNEAFDLSQPTISHHLKVLHDAGLVDREKRGVWAYYRVRTDALASVAALIACTPASG